VSVTLLIQDARWKRQRGLKTALRRAVKAALERGGADTKADLTLLLATDRHVKTLNRKFRGKDAATNVLSFPAGMKAYLGDVAIAYGVAAKEAKEEGKPLTDHAVHLAVHGVLHLQGFDHRTQRQAAKMELLEAAILKRQGIADPYKDHA
jgi:probable rRNA maturation factor